MVKLQHAPPAPLALDAPHGTTFANQVARYVHDFHTSLNVRQAKPQPGQWTVLAAFLAVQLKERGEGSQVKLLSLATGVKCLGGDVPNRDDVLVDMHAEVLARRELELLLMKDVIEGKAVPDSGVLERDDSNSMHYHLRSDTQLWLYTSHAPCGSASNASHLARLDEEDDYLRSVLSANGITSPPSTSDFRAMKSETEPRLAKKPSRADAIPTLAYTCSDKLSRYQVMGFQGGRLSEVCDPIRLSGMIVGEDFDELGLHALFGGGEGWSRTKQGLDAAIRISKAQGSRWLSTTPTCFSVLPTNERFKYGREAAIKIKTTHSPPIFNPNLEILQLPLPLLRDHLLPKPVISPSSIASTYHANSTVEVIGPHGRPTHAVRDKKTGEWGAGSRSRLARGAMWEAWEAMRGENSRKKGCDGWREAGESLEAVGPFAGWHKESEAAAKGADSHPVAE